MRSKKRKTKSGPQPVKLTPENYIIKRGRTIPIFKCYINETWNENGLAFIFIYRKHRNCFFTFCSYHVDMLCQGIKDTYYGFNISHNERHEQMKMTQEGGFKMLETDYPLVHNIIFGAVALLKIMISFLIRTLELQGNFWKKILKLLK